MAAPPAAVPVFSAAGDSLALATADGLIRVYDTSTGRLKVTLGGANSMAAAKDVVQPKGSLVEKHTCMVWATSTRKKKKSSSWSTLLVVGTAAGDVKAYDTQLGELKWRASIEGGVSALAHCPHKPGVLLVAGPAGQLATLSMESGELQDSFQASKHAITCLAVSADGQYAYGGGSALALWQLSEQQRAAKFTGHTVPATCAVFCPGSTATVTSSPGERQVALWSTPAAASNSKDDQAGTNSSPPGKTGKQKGLQSAAAVLSMEQPAVQLGAGGVQGETSAPSNGHVSKPAPSQFYVCAVSEGKEAYVWQCVSTAAGTWQGTSLARVKVQSHGSSNLQDGILAAKLLPGPSLLVARGSTACPVFETLTLPSQPGTSTATLTLEPLTSGALLPGVQAAGGSTAVAGSTKPSKAVQRADVDVAVVGPGVDVPGAAAAVPVMRTAALAAAAGGGGGGGGGGGALSEVDMAGEEDEEDAADAPPEALQPLGERVAALQAAVGTGGPAGADGEAAEGPQAGPQASDKANSLAVLLTQALRSNDRTLLERCLSTTNQNVIINTVARLLPLDAAAFLRAAVDRLLSTPARAGQLAPWVKAVLHHHTGYIMSAPGAQAPLAALYQAIDARVSTYQQLLRLHGRLGLITAHNRAAQRVADAAGGAAAVPVAGRLEPETVFEDEEDEEAGVEVEDAFGIGPVGSEEDEEEGSEGGSEDGFGNEEDDMVDDEMSDGEDDDEFA